LGGGARLEWRGGGEWRGGCEQCAAATGAGRPLTRSSQLRVLNTPRRLPAPGTVNFPHLWHLNVKFFCCPTLSSTWWTATRPSMDPKR
jgi:hypothetical protein